MDKRRREPIKLKRGKAFHKKVQKKWLDNAEGEIVPEKSLTKPSGRKGRMDIFAGSDNNMVAIVEIKASDWDKMIIKSVHRNVNRQAKQIWDYIDSQLKQKKEVSPGMIFPKRPRNTERMLLIEKLFEEHGIPVVWEDESIEERKARS